jgi:hypothetical protein
VALRYAIYGLKLHSRDRFVLLLSIVEHDQLYNTIADPQAGLFLPNVCRQSSAASARQPHSVVRLSDDLRQDYVKAFNPTRSARPRTSLQSHQDPFSPTLPLLQGASLPPQFHNGKSPEPRRLHDRMNRCPADRGRSRVGHAR